MLKCPKCGYELEDDEIEEKELDHMHIPGQVCLKCHPDAGLILTFPYPRMENPGVINP